MTNTTRRNLRRNGKGSEMKKYNHTQLIAEWERMGRPEVEYLCRDGEWLLSNSVIFYDDIQYRIKCKPWINWEHVSEKVASIATYKDGTSGVFSSIPTISERGGFFGGGLICNANVFASFTQGTCDWKDSLVMRPVVVGEDK